MSTHLDEAIKHSHNKFKIIKMQNISIDNINNLTKESNPYQNNWKLISESSMGQSITNYKILWTKWKENMICSKQWDADTASKYPYIFLKEQFQMYDLHLLLRAVQALC